MKACKFAKTARRESNGKFIAKHGQTDSGAMISYLAAKYRCTNPNADNYARYGGRGIQFRFESFEQFYQELGDRPAGMTLDRIKTDGHYEVGNVRWATKRTQNNNRAISKDYFVFVGSEC
jgi:hypothetical protein